MSNDKYYDKYIKYKSKYTELKQQHGGSDEYVTFFFTKEQYIEFINVTWERLVYDENLYAKDIEDYQKNVKFDLKTWIIKTENGNSNNQLRLLVDYTSKKYPIFRNNNATKYDDTSYGYMNIIKTTNIDYTTDMSILNSPSKVIGLFKIINGIIGFPIRKEYNRTDNGEHWDKPPLELLTYEQANFEYAVVMYISFFSRWNRVTNVFKYTNNEITYIINELKNACANDNYEAYIKTLLTNLNV
jgi:hypothetical protein